jgi:hypothetical protein
MGDSPLGLQKIANEHYWFVSERHLGHGLTLLREAERFARDQGCSHFILNASIMASGDHEKVERICEILEFKPFEKSFIKEI